MISHCQLLAATNRQPTENSYTKQNRHRTNNRQQSLCPEGRLLLILLPFFLFLFLVFLGLVVSRLVVQIGLGKLLLLGCQELTALRQGRLPPVRPNPLAGCVPTD